MHGTVNVQLRIANCIPATAARPPRSSAQASAFRRLAIRRFVSSLQLLKCVPPSLHRGPGAFTFTWSTPFVRYPPPFVSVPR
jgi:hypothetical protein